MRLINADVFEDELRELHYWASSRNSGTIEKIRYRLGQQPTVDAVEVVRCKNCIHKHEYTEYLLYCFHHGMTKKYNDFCSYGECRGD